MNKQIEKQNCFPNLLPNIIAFLFMFFFFLNTDKTCHLETKPKYPKLF